MSVTNEELVSVSGGKGATLTWKVLAIAGAVIVGAGILSGFVNPKQCRNRR